MTGLKKLDLDDPCIHEIYYSKLLKIVSELDNYEQQFLPSFDRRSSPRTRDKYIFCNTDVWIYESDTSELLAFIVGTPIGYRYHIKFLYVHPEHRGIGIGKHLIEASIKHAQEQHCKFLDITVLNNNELAKTFYTKMGFEFYLETMYKLI
jgi:ribosomal protein S18 acetylase RimI-like enzyme